MSAKNFDYTSKEHTQGPKHRLPVGANEKPVVTADLERGFSPKNRGYGFNKGSSKGFMPTSYDGAGGG